MIRFACPKCRRSHRTGDDDAGAEVVCDCGRTLTVPVPVARLETPAPLLPAALATVAWLLYAVAALGLAGLWLLAALARGREPGAGLPAVNDTVTVCMLLVLGYTLARAVDKLSR